MATLVTKGNPNEKNAGKFFCTFWEGGDPILSAENRYTSYDDNSDTSRIEWKGNDMVSFFTDRSQGTRILMKNYPLDPVPYFEGRRKDRIFGKQQSIFLPSTSWRVYNLLSIRREQFPSRHSFVGRQVSRPTLSICSLESRGRTTRASPNRFSGTEMRVINFLDPRPPRVPQPLPLVITSPRRTVS